MTINGYTNGHTNGNPPSQQVVLGSLDRGADYQRVLSGLQEATGTGARVQGEMVDRVLGNGEFQPTFANGFGNMCVCKGADPFFSSYDPSCSTSDHPPCPPSSHL